MFNSKSKRLGFLGTLCFHTALLLFCFFSSIGHSSVKLPKGIEIEFVPYQELKKSSEAIKKAHSNQTSDSKAFNNDENIVAKNILQDNETVNIPNEEDSVTAFLDPSDEPKVTQQTEDALFTALEPETDVDVDSLLENSDEESSNLSNEETTPNPAQEGYELFNSDRVSTHHPKPAYNCNEIGLVVVKVRVNREGKTVWAELSAKGSTNASSCLVKEATQAALKTIWQPGNIDGPEELEGKIIYNFQNEK